MCIIMCIYIYIYIHRDIFTYRERERERGLRGREGERERGREGERERGERERGEREGPHRKTRTEALLESHRAPREPPQKHFECAGSVYHFMWSVGANEINNKHI